MTPQTDGPLSVVHIPLSRDVRAATARSALVNACEFLAPLSEF